MLFTYGEVLSPLMAASLCKGLPKSKGEFSRNKVY